MCIRLYNDKGTNDAAFKKQKFSCLLGLQMQTFNLIPTSRGKTKNALSMHL